MTSLDERAAVNDRVSRLLEETLTVDAPPPGVDLIDSGLLDSLAIVRLIVALEQEFGVEVALEQLNLADLRTIAAIGALVTASGSRRAALDPGLVCLREGTSGPPVFVFPGVAGEAFGMLALTRRLTTRRPVFGIEGWGAPGLRGEPATIEQRAERSLRSIRSAGTVGPVSLVGFSFGGLVAYEVARRLARQGEGPALLALIDTHADVHAMPPAAQWRYRLGRPWRYVANVLSDPVQRVPHYLGRARAHLEPPAVGGQGDPHGPEFVLGGEAVAAYRPGTYPGDVVLFSTAEDNPHDCPPRRIWKTRVRGRLTVNYLPSHHRDILAETAAELAAGVDALL
jgi:thioesterase domain-containing protein/acyl carrier protein